ncbi:PhnD/SsuA/transferrin family substrate-binding protein [Salinicoccus halitifaciens]|uniref:Phosphonate transport system substrate-binding protein n=1 Tax=Salinicoccus halitifaciens TaxID=1073415 RepID=A0ABV2EBX3_9STAP|nr:PhnD/SsuA/transferrin family substrate-binding protein [Salinicoccus halitifaciens]MCD2137411.1 PhnD/SsuA/transferrin family substrate-binding protein [Salinicoccus halitifaciens]
MRNLIYLLLGLTVFLAACGNGSGEDASAEGNSDGADSGETNDDPIVLVWYPNESGNELEDGRDEMGAIIEEATGREVEHQLTTDYAIAIESIVNDNADLAFTGAEGYIQANDRNDAIQPLVVPSGPSGTEEDALYYSWFAALPENMEEYSDGEGGYSLDNFEGKNFSFVSSSSTSGFRVPSSTLVAHFSEQEEYADLEAEDLAESGTLFNEVMFGNTHQGSAVNLLNGRADLAAFCDTCVENYVEVVDGEENTAGATYQVKEDAAQPFESMGGQEFGIISATPVLNAPFIMNTGTLSEEEVASLRETMTSDEVANNEKIFVPEDSDAPALFTKSADERFVEVEDAWFDPIRELNQ